VGKGTVVRRLTERNPGLSLSVSCTTRPPRPGEVDGIDYHFLSPEEFDRRVGEGAFLEWAEVYGHRYGTLMAPVAEALERDKEVILEIDVQGAARVRERMPDAVLIFLAPPSFDALVERIRRRHTEDEPAMARRLAAASREMEQVSWFDHVVINDEVDRAAGEVAAIINANPYPRRGQSRPV
jgi:guanylate kinase